MSLCGFRFDVEERRSAAKFGKRKLLVGGFLALCVAIGGALGTLGGSSKAKRPVPPPVARPTRVSAIDAQAVTVTLRDLDRYCSADDEEEAAVQANSASTAAITHYTRAQDRLESGEFDALIAAYRHGPSLLYDGATGSETMREVLSDALIILDPDSCSDPFSVLANMTGGIPLKPAWHADRYSRRLQAELDATA